MLVQFAGRKWFDGLPFTKGDPVYEKPKVQRFGTFRELTQAGVTGACDGFTVTSTDTGVTSDGNNWNPSSGSCGSRS